jgi:ribosome-associated translation inhibitor RaiA
MNIKISNRRNLLGKQAQANVKSRIRASLSKFGRKIKSVQLSTDDVNGPRGGIDKQCRILVKLNRLGDVVTTVDDESLSRAISAAIKTAERSVNRKVQRASKSVSRTRFQSSFGLV